MINIEDARAAARKIAGIYRIAMRIWELPTGRYLVSNSLTPPSANATLVEVIEHGGI